MSKTKYDFMRDMLTRANNRYRRQMGLRPVSAAQMESSTADEPAEAPEQPVAGFNGREINPLPLGGKDGA